MADRRIRAKNGAAGAPFKKSELKSNALCAATSAVAARRAIAPGIARRGLFSLPCTSHHATTGTRHHRHYPRALHASKRVAAVDTSEQCHVPRATTVPSAAVHRPRRTTAPCCRATYFSSNNSSRAETIASKSCARSHNGRCERREVAGRGQAFGFAVMHVDCATSPPCHRHLRHRSDEVSCWSVPLGWARLCLGVPAFLQTSSPAGRDDRRECGREGRGGGR